MKTLMYKGQQCEAKRVDIYVKRGAYKHGYVKGWELYYADGSVAISGEPRRLQSAYEYQKAEFPTYKALESFVDGQNEHAARMQARREAVKEDAGKIANTMKQFKVIYKDASIISNTAIAHGLSMAEAVAQWQNDNPSKEPITVILDREYPIATKETP